MFKLVVHMTNIRLKGILITNNMSTLTALGSMHLAKLLTCLKYILKESVKATVCSEITISFKLSADY
jgi:hypothetical protein